MSKSGVRANAWRLGAESRDSGRHMQLLQVSFLSVPYVDRYFMSMLYVLMSMVPI